MTLASRQLTTLIASLLIVLTLATYAQIIGHEFINLDDNVYITENPNVQRGLTLERAGWALTSGYALNWHPLTWMSHMLDVQLFGMQPAGHHAVNLVLHIANTLLLFFVLHRATKAIWPSAFVAAIFALHPLHVESVAWVAERKDVLSTLFWFVAIWAYLRYVDKPGAGRYTIMAIVFALGLMAKPMLVTLPFILLLLDVWPLGRISMPDLHGRQRGKSRRGKQPRTFVSELARSLREKVPLILIAVGSGIATFIAQHQGEAVSTLEGLPLRVRISNALVSYVVYLRKTLWPDDLGVFYPHPLDTFTFPQVALATGLLLATTIACARRTRRQPFLIVGWLWFLVTLLPTIGIVQVGQQAYADRYTYVPMIGLSIMAAWGGMALVQRFAVHRGIVTGIAAVSVLALTCCTFVQASYWKDSETLFRHTLAVTKDNALAHNNLGVALHLKGRYAEAEAEYREILRIRPDDAGGHRNLVLALLAQGKTKAASQEHVARGTLLGKLGRTSEAISHFEQALQLAPTNVDALNNLGIVFAMQRKWEQALDNFLRAIQFDPMQANAHYNAGLVLEEEKRFDEAARHFAEAIRLLPNYAEAKAALSRIDQQRH